MKYKIVTFRLFNPTRMDEEEFDTLLEAQKRWREIERDKTSLFDNKHMRLIAPDGKIILQTR